MNSPTLESIKFAKESANRISKIEIKKNAKFSFDLNNKSSNSIDEVFLISLENGEHLNDDFLSIK
jgi:hypothetical protein